MPGAKIDLSLLMSLHADLFFFHPGHQDMLQLFPCDCAVRCKPREPSECVHRRMNA